MWSKKLATTALSFSSTTSFLPTTTLFLFGFNKYRKDFDSPLRPWCCSCFDGCWLDEDGIISLFTNPVRVLDTLDVWCVPLTCGLWKSRRRMHFWFLVAGRDVTKHRKCRDVIKTDDQNQKGPNPHRQKIIKFMWPTEESTSFFPLAYFHYTRREYTDNDDEPIIVLCWRLESSYERWEWRCHHLL